MIESKKGSIYMTIVMAIMLFMIGMIVVNFLKEPITDARTSINCDDSSAITDGSKLLCLNLDITLVYFIVLILSIAGGSILDRFII